jgi:hypothetical protein
MQAACQPTAVKSLQFCQPLAHFNHAMHYQVIFFFTDTCCNGGNPTLLKKCFGDNARICLDTFHGLQRVRKTIKNGDFKNKPEQLKRFKRLLRMSVRQSNDHGHDRCMLTDTADNIKANLEALLTQFDDLKDETVKAIKELQTHAGCLSQIPVGGGTNRNENLHGIMNSKYHKIPTMCLDLAIAQLTVLFVKHNRKIYGNQTPLISIPLQEIDDTVLSSDNVTGYGLTISRGSMTFPGRPSSEMVQKKCDRIVNNVQTLMKIREKLLLNCVTFDAMEVLLSSPIGKLTTDTSFYFARNLCDFKLTMTGEAQSILEKAIAKQFVTITGSNDKAVIFGCDEDLECHEWLMEKLSQLRSPQCFADYLKSVIIIIVDSDSQPIHTVLPQEILNPSPVILVLTTEGFFCTARIEEITINADIINCNCGASRKEDNSSCTGANSKKKCKCQLAGRKCNSLCRCCRCENPNGRRKQGNPTGGCKCGTGALSNIDVETCKAGSTCPCSQSGTPCSENKK